MARTVAMETTAIEAMEHVVTEIAMAMVAMETTAMEATPAEEAMVAMAPEAMVAMAIEATAKAMEMDLIKKIFVVQK